MAKRAHGREHGGMGNWGVGPVFQERLNSGNSNQDKQISPLYIENT